MPKVVRIINRFNLGGPTYNVAYLSKYMSPDYETVLVGGEIDESEAGSHYVLDGLGLKPIVVPEMRRSIGLKGDIVAYKKIKKIIKEEKPDIVHTHASKAGTLGRLAAASCGVPIVIHTFHGHVFHSYFGKLKTSIFKSIERFLARKSTRIIAISDIQKYELGEVHKIAPLDKIEVVQLGFDLRKFQENQEQLRRTFREKYGIQEDEIAVGIVGRLVPIKNHKLFLDAAKIVLAKTSKKVKFLLIGDGEDREELLEYCQSISLPVATEDFTNAEEKVLFTSWIIEIDMVNAGLDIVALSSLNEGTPVSLIEAQAASNPIVSTDVGGIRNVIIENETGLLSKVGDVDGYAKNLLSLLEDDAFREKMSERGAEYVNKKFSYVRLVEDMKGLYKSLLNENEK